MQVIPYQIKRFLHFMRKHIIHITTDNIHHHLQPLFFDVFVHRLLSILPPAGVYHTQNSQQLRGSSHFMSTTVLFEPSQKRFLSSFGK